jgi:hypothetical protein
MERRRRWLTGLLVAALVTAGAVIAIELWSEEPESAPLDPYPDSALRMVALGDSYISGEGARRYFRGTDEPRENLCHRAATAYPTGSPCGWKHRSPSSPARGRRRSR